MKSHRDEFYEQTREVMTRAGVGPTAFRQGLAEVMYNELVHHGFFESLVEEALHEVRVGLGVVSRHLQELRVAHGEGMTTVLTNESEATLEFRGRMVQDDIHISALLAEALGYHYSDERGYEVGDKSSMDLALEVRDALSIKHDAAEAIGTHDRESSPHRRISSRWCVRCAHAGIRPDTYKELFGED